MRKFSFEINITKQCNFECTYCFEGNHCELTNDIGQHLPLVFKRIDELLYDEWWGDNYDIMNIVFWGGEPTLRPLIIKEIVDRYRKNEKVHFMMYTNGYMVDSVIETFSDIKNRFEIQVSYDGNPIHDINRKHKNGELTSAAIKTNVKKLVDEGMEVSLKSTIKIEELKYFDEAWEDIKNISIDMDFPFRYAPTLEYHDETPTEYFDEFEDSLKRYVKKEAMSLKEGNMPYLSWLDSNKNKCAFSTAGMFVDIDGGIYYCHGCSYVEDPKDFKFSYLEDDDFLDKVKDNREKFTPVYNYECDMCIATACLSCNVSKYINSSKEDFFDKWNDYTCQTDLCKYYKLFGKYNEVLNRIIRRK